MSVNISGHSGTLTEGEWFSFCEFCAKDKVLSTLVQGFKPVINQDDIYMLSYAYTKLIVERFKGIDTDSLSPFAKLGIVSSFQRCASLGVGLVITR